MLTIQRIQLERAVRYFVCLTCLTGLFLVQACQDDEEHLAPEPYQVLASIEKTEKIVFDDAVAALLEENNINDEQLAPYRQIKNMASRIIQRTPMGIPSLPQEWSIIRRAVPQRASSRPSHSIRAETCVLRDIWLIPNCWKVWLVMSSSLPTE